MTWSASAAGPADEQLARYDATRRSARNLGFEYVENEQLRQFPIKGLLNRLEALVAKGVGEPVNRAARLGTEKRPVLLLSKLFVEFEQVVAEEIKACRRSNCASGTQAAFARSRNSSTGLATSR